MTGQSSLHDFTVDAAELVAALSATVAGNSPARGVALWDGSSWRGLGAVGFVQSVVVWNGDLWWLGRRIDPPLGLLLLGHDDLLKCPPPSPLPGLWEKVRS